MLNHINIHLPWLLAKYVILKQHWSQFNSLWPSDSIWQQRSGSTLAQVMAWCLTAPSHYLNQCWLIISEVQWQLYEGNFARDASTINHQNLSENYISKISFKFPRGQWVKKKLNYFSHLMLTHNLQIHSCIDDKKIKLWIWSFRYIQLQCRWVSARKM